MFSQTEDGIEIDFDDGELDSPVARIVAIGLTRLLSAFWEIMSIEPISARRAQEGLLSLRLVRLAMRYMEETTKCLDAEAHFAASLTGMALLETLLMLGCIAEKARVQTCKVWTSFHQKRKLAFRDRLMHVDASKLIEIGEELGWFPKGSERVHYIKDYDGWEEVKSRYPEFGEEVSDGPMQTLQIRNLIHPAKCMRQGILIEDRVTEVGAGLMMITLISYMHHLGSDLAEASQPRLAIRFSDQWKRIIASHSEIEKRKAEGGGVAKIEKVEDAVHVLELMRPALHDLTHPE